MDYNNNNELEFRQIVLRHIQKILEISASELRDKTTVHMSSNSQKIIENEDTRYSYIQAIENLAYVLLPHFDNQVIKVYDECIEIINAYGGQVKTKFEKEYQTFSEELKSKDGFGNLFVMRIRMKYAKKLFVELNKLLHRNDYLKSAVYGEDQDDIVEETE